MTAHPDQSNRDQASEDQSQTYASDALRLMCKYHIEPTPQNYQIWYTYASGRDPDLMAALDMMINSGRAITEEHCAEITEQFFFNEQTSKQVHQASTRLQALANSLLSHVEQAGAENSAAGERVATLSSSMTDPGRSDDVQHLAASLMKEAKLIENVVNNLQQNLGAHNNKLTELRSTLVKMRREATTDPLTGLANRRGFSKFLNRAAEIAQDSAKPLSLILLDIDHFKMFNDTHGHRLGDEVLKTVASRLRLNLKGQDLPARYGGEEFIAILPGTSLDDAVTVAETIRRALGDSNLVNKVTGDRYGRVTASFGVSRYLPGEPLEDFIQRADKALYEAKKRGRNRVHRADDNNAAHASPRLSHDIACD